MFVQFYNPQHPICSFQNGYYPSKHLETEGDLDSLESGTKNAAKYEEDYTKKKESIQLFIINPSEYFMI